MASLHGSPTDIPWKVQVLLTVADFGGFGLVKKGPMVVVVSSVFFLSPSDRPIYTNILGINWAMPN